MARVAMRRAAQMTGIAPQFLVDNLERALAYYHVTRSATIGSTVIARRAGK